MITEVSALSQGQLSDLAGRGVDDLLTEYHGTPDAGRKQRLSDFLRLCMPDASPRTDMDRDVQIAGLEELKASGRVSLLKKGSDVVLEVLGKTIPDADIMIFDISGATIISDQTVLLDGMYVTNQVRHMSGGWLTSGEGYDLKALHDLNRATRSARLRLPAACSKLPDSHVYFLFQGVVGCVSFGHFLLDTLVQLIVYDHLKTHYGAALKPVIVNDYPWVFKWPGMEWLFAGLVEPITEIVHVQSESCIEVTRAFTTNRLVHIGDGGISLAAFAYMRERIFERFPVTPGSSSPKRLYVSRKDAGYREAGNIDKVEQILAELDFTTVVIQDLSPQEAYDIFSGAEIILGMHGSGLMYHAYTRHPATVVELSYPGFEWDVILGCAAACGHQAVRVPYNGEDIDIAALEATLSGLGGALST